ncbi:MAG: ABC transporter permease, partial [Sporomusa sp.]
SIGQIKLQELLFKKMQSVAGKQSGSPFEVRLRNWYNIEGNSKYSILPAVTCAMLLLTPMLLFSLNVATDRQQGVTDRLKALGVSQALYFSAKAVPYFGGAILQFTILLFIQIFFFDLPFRGNIFLLYLITGVYIITCLAIAFVVAGLVTAPSQTSPLIIAIFLVSILLGGFIAPRYGLADFLYWCGYVSPMTYFLEIMRGIMLKGVGIVELWPSFIGVIAYFLLAMLLVTKNKSIISNSKC